MDRNDRSDRGDRDRGYPNRERSRSRDVPRPAYGAPEGLDSAPRDRETVRQDQETRRLELTAMVLDVNPKGKFEDLFALFHKQAGRVVDVQLLQDSVTKEFRGIAYFEFANADALRRSFALSGHVFHGVPIKVQASQGLRNKEIEKEKMEAKLRREGKLPSGGPGGQSGPRGETGTKIHVSGLAPDATQPELKSFFSQYGEVLSVDMPRDHMSQPKGFAFVEFRSADVAVQLLRSRQAVLFKERSLRINPTAQSAQLLQQAEQGGVPAAPPAQSMYNQAPPPAAASGDRYGRRDEPSAYDRNDRYGAPPSRYGDRDGGDGDRYDRRDPRSAPSSYGRPEGDLRASIPRGGDLRGPPPPSVPSGLAPATERTYRAVQSMTPSSSTASNVLLANVFTMDDVASEAGGDLSRFLADLIPDINMEARRYGDLTYSGVSRVGQDVDGCVWLKYQSPRDAQYAIQKLNGRAFGGRTIAALAASEEAWSQHRVA